MIEWPNLTTKIVLPTAALKKAPERNSCKLVENGRVNVLIISRLLVGKIAKSFPAKNNRKKLSVGYLLKLSSNQHPGKLEEVFKNILGNDIEDPRC